MSKSPWGNIGAWAAEAEREEQEQKELAAKAAAEAEASGGAGGGGGRDPQSFPPLKESVATASKQTKKKTRMTLQEFNMQSAYGSGSSSSAQRGLTQEEMLRLPTGPKERAPGDDSGGRIGGGFSSYGSGRGGDGPRRSYGGFEDDRRRSSPRVSDSDQISRADEVDNWASMKKPSALGGSARPNRYASLVGAGDGGFSRADEVDNWASMKKNTHFPPPHTARSSSFGSGSGSGSRPEPDRWTREREVTQDKQSLVLDDAEFVKVNKPNPFGAARPREEVLAEKGLDWKKLESDIETKKILSRPTSSHSSRPGSSQSAMSELMTPLQGAEESNANANAAAVKARPKVNPFGDAKPREVLLQEKGLDWRKIDFDLEHRRVERPESEEEKILKEEIKRLKKESAELSDDSQLRILEQINQKEKDLELLIRELDDKVRFGQKPVERPGSGAGRFGERPPSSSDRQRGGEFMDRPRSRGGGEFMDRPRSRGGSGDMSSRPMDDRRPMHGGRGRGYPGGNRDMDRPTLRGDRW